MKPQYVAEIAKTNWDDIQPFEVTQCLLLRSLQADPEWNAEAKWLCILGLLSWQILVI